jgi:two-component system, NtrC family, sensor histidine kinase KinB
MRRRTTVAPSANSAHGDPAQNLEPEQLLGQVRQLLAEAQALSTRLAALNEVAVAMQQSMATDETLSAMVRQARWVLDFQHCSLALRTRSGYRYQVLRGDASLDSGEQESAIHAHAILPALRNRQAQLVSKIVEADGAPPGMGSAIILPLSDAREVVGTLNFYAHDPDRYSLNDLRIAHALALQVAAILQNRRLFGEVERTRDELRTVMESIGDGVLVIDRRGRVLLFNQAFRSLLEIPDVEGVGRRALGLLRISGAVPNKSRRALWRALARGITGTGSVGTSELALTNGLHVEWSSVPLVTTDCTVGYVITVRDVSARRQLEALREDLIKMLVHDLRSPLTSLMMILDMLDLEQGYNFGADEKVLMLKEAKQAAVNLHDRIGTLLDLGKLEAGKFELERAVCPVEALVESALSSIRPLAQYNRQQLSVEIAAGLPDLYVDVRLLQRVLENLLSNALKFSPLDSPIIIRAQIGDDRSSVMLSVEDNGPGISPDARESIFEKYQQLPGQKRRTGTGLGLTFCKLAVDAHGGQIGVAAAPVRGSVFWLRLPLHAPRVGTASG